MTVELDALKRNIRDGNIKGVESHFADGSRLSDAEYQEALRASHASPSPAPNQEQIRVVLSRHREETSSNRAGE